MSEFVRGEFLIGQQCLYGVPSVAKRKGWVGHGLGLHQTQPGSPKGRRKPVWQITHLGTGHRLGRGVQATEARALAILLDVAAMTDWTAFDSVEGWRNVFPDMHERLQAYAAACPEWHHGGPVAGQSGEVARQIAEARG